MRPLVSIVTPFFNAAPFLADAIESVLAQQDFPRWELILIDDGSMDASGAIACTYCRRDRRIRLVSHAGQANRGSSAARNLGILCSQGQLIAFLDADDTWMPGKLRCQVETLNAHPEAPMIYGAAERWYSWDTAHPAEPDQIVPAVVPGIGTNVLIPPPELLRAYLRDESVTPCTCTVVVRREAAIRAGGFEESFTGLYDDQVFYAKICLEYPVFVMADCVARYRQHPNSCCATARRMDTGEQGRAHFLEWLHAYSPVCIA